MGKANFLNQKNVTRIQWKYKSPFILLVNPFMRTKKYDREDKLRNYLSLGTLAGALVNKQFLRKFACQLGKNEFVCKNESEYPSFKVKVADLSLKKGKSIEEYLHGFIVKNSIETIIIACTATSAQLDEAKEVSEIAKRIVPRALRVIGGPHVSVLPDEYLNDTDYQVACIGEGVETFTELALQINVLGNTDLSRIQGIAYKDGTGKVRINSYRKYVLSLDDYPFPSDSLYLFIHDLDNSEKKGQDLVYLFVGFGCQYNCDFCAQRAVHRGIIRERSADNIFAEIRKLTQKGFRKFAIVQETFFNNKDRVNCFCHLIEDSNLQIEWTAETRADQIDYELLKTMKDAGLKFIQIGLESGDQKLLDTIGKKIKLEQVKMIIYWLKKLKIDTALYLLLGLPGQDWQSILKSAVFLKENIPYNRKTMHISVAITIPYPGTRIAKDGSVRLLRHVDSSLDWPPRNPEVIVNEDGELIGKNFTETNDMTAREIFESMFYLDDFCHFLLHSKYNPLLTHIDRLKAYNFANKMFYMMERRTIRDLIIRAQINLSPEKRNRAYMEILELDRGEEVHFRDVSAFTERQIDLFTKFLTNISFINGFHTMKILGIANRIKWMKLCSVIWGLLKKSFDKIHFDLDFEKVGMSLNEMMGRIDLHQLNIYLEMLDSEVLDQRLFKEITITDSSIRAFGVRFYLSEEKDALNIAIGCF